MATPSWTTFPDTEPPKAAQELAARVQADGGHVLALYREPVGDHWQIFCLLPLARVEASPYVKNYVLARTTPLTRARKTLPSFEQTFRKLRESLADFDVGKVRYEDIQRSAIMAIPAQE